MSICIHNLKRILEGGTWLAIDEKGRLAVLTNVYTGKQIKSAGRGFLVIDYLKDKKPAQKYLSDLSNSKVMFSPFNLCIFEPLDNNGYEAVYFKNTFKDESKGLVIPGDGPKLLPHGVSGFGNHPISEPYKKTELGINTFTNIINQNLESSSLEEEVIKLLNIDQHMYPDEQMQKQSGINSIISNQKESDFSAELENEEIKSMLNKEKLLSSIFVDIGASYGTRMQTIIFVDYKRNVKFIERTRVSNTSPIKWDVKEFNFNFD